MKKSSFLTRVIVSLIIISLIIPFSIAAQTDQSGSEDSIVGLTEITEVSPDGSDPTSAQDSAGLAGADSLLENPEETIETSDTTTTETTATVPSETEPSETTEDPTAPSETEPSATTAEATTGTSETDPTAASETKPEETTTNPSLSSPTDPAATEPQETTALTSEPKPTEPTSKKLEEDNSLEVTGEPVLIQEISPLALPPDAATDPTYYIDNVNTNYKRAMSLVGYFNPPTIHDTAAQPDTEIPVPTVEKTATTVAGLVNAWDIALEIMSKDVRKTADIVLVLDTSGSMAGTKLTAMKDAANIFIDTVLVNDTTRVAIVSYDYYADNSIGFRNSSHKQQLKDFVNLTSAAGGTFTQDALRAAQIILDTYSTTASSKHIVLLSDGLPTYSYPLTDPNLYLGSNLTGRVHESVNYDYIDYPTTGHYYAYRQNGVPASPTQSMFDLNWRIGSGNAQHVMYYDGDLADVDYTVTRNDASGTYFLYNGDLYLKTGSTTYTQYTNYITIDGNRYYPVGPTYYYRPYYNYYLYTLPTARYIITANAGDGISRYHYLPANTIAQSKIAQQQGYIVHTVALAITPDPYTGVNGDLVLRDIASTPAHAYKASTDNLAAIFATIAGSIISSISNASVTDPLGPGFAMSYSGGNPFFNADGLSVGVNFSAGEAIYTLATKTVTWNVGSLSAPISVGGQPYHYERLTYRLEIDDGILDPAVPRFDRNPDGTGTANTSGNFYRTNGTTTLTYKNSAGVLAATINFPIPVVNPIFLRVEKILQDAAGNTITDPDLTFTIRIQSDATDGDIIYPEYDRSFNLKSGEFVITTDLRLADVYTVSEISNPDYDVSFKVNESTATTFTVQAPSGSPLLDSGQSDIEVEVFNKAKVQLTNVTIDKTVSGLLGDRNRIFTFEAKVMTASGDPADYDVTAPDPGAAYSYDSLTGIYSFSLKHGESVSLPDLPQDSLIWLRETNTADYTITVRSGSEPDTINYSVSEGWYKITITENISIHVENFKDAVPDTGVSLDSWPYFLILGLVVVGALSFFIIRRLRSKD